MHKHKKGRDNENVTSHSLKNYECKKCEVSITGWINYANHCKEAHDEKISKFESINCDSCSETFHAPSYYIQHYQTVHEGMPPEYSDKELFACEKCPQMYISKWSLVAHKSNVHNENTHGVKIDRRKNPRKVCHICQKVFKSCTYREEHILAKHEKKTPNKCDQCHRSYGTIAILKKHKNLVHERVICDECGKEICNSFILKRHKQSMHGIIPQNSFCCEKCPLFFSSQLVLDRHVNSKHASDIALQETNQEKE